MEPSVVNLNAHSESPARNEGEAPRTDPYAEIARLSRRPDSRSRFLGNALRTLARHFNSPYAALHARCASEVVQDDCHLGPTDPKFWRSALQQFLTESLTAPAPRAKLLRAKSGGARVAFLSAPLVDPAGPAIGAVALVAPIRDEEQLPILVASLEGLCRCASLAADGVVRQREPGRESPLGDRAVARAATCSTAEELAFALTNELRNKLACEQVALGLLDGRHVRLLSISGLDLIPTRGPGAEALRSAMEECVDAGMTLQAKKGEKWSEEDWSPGYRLHRQWHTMAAGDAVASIPLRHGEQAGAVVSLRKRSERGWTEEELESIRSRVEPFVPAFRMLTAAQRGLGRHALDSASARWRWLLAPRRVGRKAAFGTVLLLGAWFCFGTAPYALTVRGVVAPAVERHLSAPFDGVLVEAFVTGGATVSAGDPMCRFDTRELEEQVAQLSAEQVVLERQRDRAMADGSPVEVRLAEANEVLVRARLAILRNRMEQATLRAPFDGLVVSGDLRRQIGAVVAEGAPLFVVSPRHGWRVEMMVPESGADEVPIPTTGTFAAFARPEERCALEVIRLSPTADARGRGNAFLAEARMVGGGDWLRPGMEGVARVHAGSRRIWWSALHGVVDWVRLRLWP